MNIKEKTTAAQIRIDGFRAGLTVGVLHLSEGVIALDAAMQMLIIAAVRRFDDFDDFDDSDECGSHDIGDVEVELVEPGIATWRELVFFRINEIQLPGADAPRPMLTIMLASEWWQRSLRFRAT